MHQAVADAAAMEGGLLSGGGMALLGKGALFGGLAYGAVKAVQGVKSHMDAAQRELVETSDLRHMLGPLTHDFETLRVTVRDLTDDFGLTTDESVKLAREMAHTSGVVDEDLRTASRFAREYGMEPNGAGRFFSEMRHLGASRNDADNRRLALLIGEAVNRDGIRHRTDELLGEVTALATATARASLTSPHSERYVEAVSTLAGSGLPGLAGDPSMAGRILALVDEAFRHGGAAGEASKSFTLGMFQREVPHVSAFDLNLIQSGGALATVADSFGPESPAYQLAVAMGDVGAQRRYEALAAEGGTTTHLSRLMHSLERESGGSADWMRLNVSGYTGLPEPQAAALATAYLRHGGFDRLQKDMSDNGLNPESIREAGAYSEIMFTPGAAKREWDKLRAMKEVPEAEKAKVAGLIEGNGGTINEAAQREIARLAARFDSQEDEGARARRARINLDREFSDFSKTFVEIETGIREGVLELVRMLPTDSARRYVAKQEEAAKLAAAEFRAPDDIRKAAAAFASAKTPKDRRAVIEGLRTLDRQHPGQHTPAYRQALDDLERGANAYDGGGAANRRDKAAALSPEHRSVLDDVAAKHGFDPALLREVLNREGSGAHAVSPKGAQGEFQIMPGNFEGTGLDPTKFEDGAELAARVLDDARRLYGNDLAAILAYYNGGKAAGDAVHAGKPAPYGETRRYLRGEASGPPADFEAKLKSLQEGAPPELAKRMKILRDRRGATGFAFHGADGEAAMEWADEHAGEFGLKTPILRDYQGDAGFHDKIPASRQQMGAGAMEFSHQHQHTITVLDRAGNPIPAPVTTYSQTGAPTPAGTGR